VIPSPEEVGKIIEALSGPYKVAAVLMSRRGLRVGALPSLAIRDGRFKAYSKGKDINGEMPDDCIKAVRAEGLELARPFAGIDEEQIKDHFRYTTGKLVKAGTIKAPYSVHDLRHYYAVNEYRRDRDIYRLEKALGHASITVTESYLKGLGEA
jgi:integrase